MIGYVTVGTDDLAVSKPFYDAVLAPLGGKVVLQSPKMIFYAEPRGTMFALSTPYDRNPCSFGNGTMLGLTAESNAIVDEIYAIAMRNGASDEGAPGYRTPEMYIAYFRDPYGNKLAVYRIPSVEDFVAGAKEIVRARLEAEQGAGNH